MTSSLSLYQQEKARRGIELPRATGCPRKATIGREADNVGPALPMSVYLRDAVTERKTRNTKRGRPRMTRYQAHKRWNDWAKLYVEGKMTTEAIALKYGVSRQTVTEAMHKLKVTMRKGGHHLLLVQEQAKVNRLERDNTRLTKLVKKQAHIYAAWARCKKEHHTMRMRVVALRKRLSKYEAS